MKQDVYRSEKKYVIPKEVSLVIENEIQKLLMCDNNSDDGIYTIRSLYFDGYDQRDYWGKVDGDYSHKKIRVRRYGSKDSPIKLEYKEKQGDYQHKQSLLITEEEARRVQEGDTDFLLDDSDDVKLRFYKEMTLGIYRPVVLIEYERRAFVFDAYNTRITFDYDIRSSEIDLDLFEEDVAWTDLLEGYVVLEVKYDGVLFKPIDKLLKKYNMPIESYSKYEKARDLGIIYNN